MFDKQLLIEPWITKRNKTIFIFISFILQENALISCTFSVTNIFLPLCRCKHSIYCRGIWVVATSTSRD